MEDQKLIDTIHEFTYEKLDGNIANCLNAIIEKLKNGQMSAMIGAGFSKNANSAYPDWSQLMVDAYKELYPEKYESHEAKIREEIIKKEGETDKDKEQQEKIIQEKLRPVISGIIRDPSNLAQEYIDMKGRREDLDIYIENALVVIEDNETNNLTLHEKLLSLNWNDIITQTGIHYLNRQIVIALTLLLRLQRN